MSLSMSLLLLLLLLLSLSLSLLSLLSCVVVGVVAAAAVAVAAFFKRMASNWSKMAPKRGQHGWQRAPGGFWGLLGALEKAWSAKGGLPGAYGAPLGGVLEASGGQQE